MRIHCLKMLGLGDGPIKLNTKFAILLFFLFLVAFVFLVVPSKHQKPPRVPMIYEPTAFEKPYNATYPFTKQFVDDEGFMHLKVALISDPDQGSKSSDGNWASKLQFAELSIDEDWNSASFRLTDSVPLEGHLAYQDRGLELSELIVFNGKLYTVCDRTGVLYEITDTYDLVPWVILPDGEGNMNKGFKAEWMAVKDQVLFVGSMGKPYSDSKTGEVINYNPMFVKAISHTGQVQNLDWRINYESLASSVGVNPSGYILHESASWSQHHKQWFFLPRKESTEPYNEESDEERGSNVLIRTQASFTHTKVHRLGPIKRTHGYSTFKFVPHTNDLVIVAIKTREYKGQLGSYLSVFHTNGRFLLDEVEISSNEKFEGIEFI
jgi:soluble calcium-activated nucleotidase 1